MTELRGIGDARIDRYLRVIQCLDGETGRQTGRSSTAASMGGEVQRIMTIPGIGLVLGITIY